MLTILNALVFSKLFYCSTVWAGTFQQNLQKLQLVQNFAARVLTGTKKFDHISPVLYKLGWLSIENQLLARDATQMYKIVNNLAPTYLCNNIHERSDVHLYNTGRKNDLNPPLCRTTTAQRSFFYRCTQTWNSLTRDTRNSLSLSSFKRKVYAELRSKAYA